MSTDDPRPAEGQHVLVLAANNLAHDTRILKQIDSLVRGGYQVSALAIADDAVPGHELENPNRHIYRFRTIREKKKNPLPLCPGTAEGLYDPLDAYFRLYDRASEDQEYMRKALRLQRAISSLHWSRKVRKERRRHHRELRTRMNNLIARDDSTRSAARFALIAWYEAGAFGFVDTSSEFSMRIKDLGPPKVVHAHDAYTLTAGVMLSRRWGAKLVYDAHEYEPERSPPLPDKMKADFAVFEHRSISSADGLVTVSSSILDLYKARAPNIDLNLIQNCPELRLDPEEPLPGLRERIGLAPESPLAVFVGLPTLGTRGLQVTLDALQMCPDVHLAILGPRWKAQDAELVAATVEMGLSDRVHLLDPVRPHQVVSAIRDADLSICLIQNVSLSYRFSMPNKLFEALVAGVPTIVSDFPDMGALIRKHRAGLAVDETDPAAVAEAMTRILSDRAAFVPAGEARAALEADCTWQGQERVLLDLYNRLLPPVSASKAS